MPISLVVLAVPVFLASALIYALCHALFMAWRPLPVVVFGVALYGVGWRVGIFWWLLFMAPVTFPLFFCCLLGAPALSSCIKGLHAAKDTFLAYLALVLAGFLSLQMTLFILEHPQLKSYTGEVKGMAPLFYYLEAVTLPPLLAMVVWLVLDNRRVAGRRHLEPAPERRPDENEVAKTT